MTPVPGPPGELTRDGDLSIRLMRDEAAEFERLVSWRKEPHVREWWDTDEPPLTVESAVAEYRQDLGPGAPTTACIIELSGKPVGYLQFYRWASYPSEAREIGIPENKGTWGLDIFMGDRSLIGGGVGSRALDLLCRYLFEAEQASAVALCTALGNTRAQRAYEKAGFVKVRQVLDTDTRGGKRVRSWLMVRERSSHDAAPRQLGSAE